MPSVISAGSADKSTPRPLKNVIEFPPILGDGSPPLNAAPDVAAAEPSRCLSIRPVTFLLAAPEPSLKGCQVSRACRLLRREPNGRIPVEKVAVPPSPIPHLFFDTPVSVAVAAVAEAAAGDSASILRIAGLVAGVIFSSSSIFLLAAKPITCPAYKVELLREADVDAVV